MTAKMEAAAALEMANASTQGEAWPTFMAAISTEKNTISSDDGVYLRKKKRDGVSNKAEKDNYN